MIEQELEKQAIEKNKYNLADKTLDSKVINEKNLSEKYFSESSIHNIDIPRKTDQLSQDIKPILKNPYHQTVRFTSLNNDTLKSPTV